MGHIGPGGATGPEPSVTIRRSALRRAWSDSASTPTEEGDVDFYALTDLFLGEVGVSRGDWLERKAEPIAARREASARFVAPVPVAAAKGAAGNPVVEAGGIELLILGHLPVLSAAWAAQYARTISEAEGTPVAFVQVRGGHVSVEVVGGEAGPSPRAADLGDALERAAAVTGRWIVRADETEEPALARLPGVRWLTLLTSADEAAVVSAYRAIKHLAPEEAEAPPDSPPEEAGQARTWGEWPGPVVRVAIMGAADEPADAAYGKIAAAVRTFLSRPIRRAPGAPMIHAARPARPLFSGRSEIGALGVMEAIAELLRRPVAEARGGTAAAAVETAAASASATEPLMAPRDVPGMGSSVAASGGTAGPLARHVAGLVAVDLVCPYAPGVEFALGSDGRLHALTRRECRGGAGGALGVEPLLVASAWAEAHGALLRRAIGGGGGSGAIRPVAHLFVEEPREVRGLLDTEVRVHLLAAVAVGEQTAWMCKDLN